MKAVDILHAQAGSVLSRQDGSVKISFVTPELRPSEGGALLQLHGKNVRLTIIPEDVEPEEMVSVDTPRDQKSPSTRLRSIMFIIWKQRGRDYRDGETFQNYYERQIDSLCEKWKTLISDE